MTATADVCRNHVAFGDGPHDLDTQIRNRRGQGAEIRLEAFPAANWLGCEAVAERILGHQFVDRTVGLGVPDVLEPVPHDSIGTSHVEPPGETCKLHKGDTNLTLKPNPTDPDCRRRSPEVPSEPSLGRRAAG